MPNKKKSKQHSSEQLNDIETRVYNILQTLDLPIIPQTKINKYSVDFLVDDKYIVECYGDFWHCNPTQYTSSYYNRGVKKTAEEIWARDQKRKEDLQNMGYKFMCLWESEIKNSSKYVKKKIKGFIKKE